MGHLVQRGLAGRVDDPRDRRVVLGQLLAEGKRLMVGLCEGWHDCMEEWLCRMGVGDLEHLLYAVCIP